MLITAHLPFSTCRIEHCNEACASRLITARYAIHVLRVILHFSAPTFPDTIALVRQSIKAALLHKHRTLAVPYKCGERCVLRH